MIADVTWTDLIPLNKYDHMKFMYPSIKGSAGLRQSSVLQGGAHLAGSFSSTNFECEGAEK